MHWMGKCEATVGLMGFGTYWRSMLSWAVDCMSQYLYTLQKTDLDFQGLKT